jgi:hypothetical protein
MSKLSDKVQDTWRQAMQSRLAELESDSSSMVGSGSGSANGIEAMSLRLCAMQQSLRSMVVQCHPQAGIAAPEALRFVRDASR